MSVPLLITVFWFDILTQIDRLEHEQHSELIYLHMRMKLKGIFLINKKSKVMHIIFNEGAIYSVHCTLNDCKYKLLKAYK